MRYNTRKPIKKSKNKPLLIGLVVLSCLIGGTLYARSNRGDSKDQATDTNAVTAEQLAEEAEVNAEIKQEVIDRDKGAPSNTGTPPDAPATSVELTARQESDNTVTIFTRLPGYSDGECRLKVTNGGNSYTQEAQVVFQREASSCAGFSVPINSLGTGDWTVKLDVTSNGSTETKTISQKVN